MTTPPLCVPPRRVEFYRHSIEQEDIDRVSEVLRSIFLTTGRVTKEFEAKFARALGTKHAVGVMSCTHALTLALKALGIGEGDEVITTPMSFVATANAIIEAGARPVFVDVEPRTGNLDAGNVGAAITPRTRAVLPVHLYGQMCDMRALRRIADAHGIAIVEDCAHCIEAERDGVRPGQLGEISCFSFYATKNITSGEGGAATTNDDALAEKLYVLRLHGMSKHAVDRYQRLYQHYDVEQFGYKANMFDIQAALLIGQLDRMDVLWRRRRAICDAYESALEGQRRLDFPRPAPGSKSACHLFTIWVDPAERDRVLMDLQERGVGVAVNYRAMHLYTAYRKRFGYRRGDFPEAEKIGDRTITLPLYPRLTDEEVAYVVRSVREAVRAEGGHVHPGS